MTYDQTHWVPVQQRRPLPTFYYHEHFKEMLGFVGEHYKHALLDSHIAYLNDFRDLTREAQCLYVRLVNRKGRIFAVNRLRYPELGEVQTLLSELGEKGWVGSPTAVHFADVLRFLTKSEIYRTLLPKHAGLGRSLKKGDLIAFARKNVSPEAFFENLDLSRLVVQQRSDATNYLLFLFFGRIKDGLSEFTMRDLGLVRTQNLNESYEPRFSDRTEALEHYYFASRIRALKNTAVTELHAVRADIPKWPATNFPGSAALRDELACKLGRQAERGNMIDLALAFYEQGESAECSERTVRLLLGNDQRDAAKRFLERCLDDPRSDEEWLVACDLYERKFNKKRTSMLTDALRAGALIDIDESRSGAPERAVAEHFEKQGISAYRTENHLWRTFFGLLFWDELFVDAAAGVHSPFEFLPAALTNNSFYAKNQDELENKLSLLSNPDAVKRRLLKVSTRYYGTPNGVFRWRHSMNDAVFALIDGADSAALAVILRRLCQGYTDSRYGYPDLMLVDGKEIRFVEVKTEGDQLRRNQLLRLRQLRDAGFRAEILRVRWVLDPQQTYVVVDVETTGGRGINHRVTEIGAVKVRNGKVVDHFQTLLNPQRSIPANITRLTGITPEMVADAPYFMDVADEFESFMGDAIFVAHNVEFDYGFIAAEFKRRGRPFRHAKLCTCASMRRLYPGHQSYSLAALTRAFDIPLRQHHRALCDAEAAAELLLLINEKRERA
ncbi:MAG: exonuclease domain-containing protein [Woeseiaceae bacterium]